MPVSDEYKAWKQTQADRNSRLKSGEQAAQKAFQQWIKANPGVTNRQPGVEAAFRAWLQVNPGENWAAYSAPQGWKQGAPTTMTPNQSYDQFGQLISAGMIQGTPEQKSKQLPPFPPMPGTVPSPGNNIQVGDAAGIVGSPITAPPPGSGLPEGVLPAPITNTRYVPPGQIGSPTPIGTTPGQISGATPSPLGGLPINPSQVNPYLANPLMASYYGMQSPYFGGNQTQEQPDFTGNQSTFQAPSVGGAVQNKY